MGPRGLFLGRAAAIAAAAFCLAAAEPADSPVNVPEPPGLYTGPQRGYTPPTLKAPASSTGRRSRR